MWHYDSKTPKRTILWSNSRSIGMFWTSPLRMALVKATRAERQDDPKPCRTYTTHDGRKRFHGTSALKQTETGSQLELQ